MACFPATKLQVLVDLHSCRNCSQFIHANLQKKMESKACAYAKASPFSASLVSGSVQRLKILTGRSVLCRSHAEVDQDFVDAINNVRDIVMS